MSDNHRDSGQMIILVNGNELPPEVGGALEAVLVEDDLAQPAMFSLRFNDPTHAILDGGQLSLGAAVVIKAAARQGAASKTIFSGEITALEPGFEQRHIGLTVRGYDRSHRLHRGRSTRTFVRQSDADIVDQIARARGLRADAEAGPAPVDYLMQHNQTDMQFLAERAARLGFRVAVDDKTLRFTRAEGAPEAAPAQVWGSTLLSFQARLSLVAQPNEVQVRGWDPQLKREIVGTASRAARPLRLPVETSGGPAAQAAFGEQATLTITDRLVTSKREADRLAQAILDERSGDFLTAEGLCLGEPSLRAGCSVELQDIGASLSGSYFVTASRHSYTPREGYQTQFFVRGHRAAGLLAAIEPAPPAPALAGVAVGIVTNVNDPERQGRVKVRLPWLDDQHESDWARVAAPGAGGERGLMLLPEIDDEVLVAFEQGDINRPYVLGGLWNGKDKPPIPGPVRAGKVERRAFKTRAGHTLSFSDEDGKGSITITTAGGQQIILDDQAPGKIRIACGGEIEIAGQGGKLSIGASGVELSSDTALTLKAGADLTIQGAMVNIN